MPATAGLQGKAGRQPVGVSTSEWVRCATTCHPWIQVQQSSTHRRSPHRQPDNSPPTCLLQYAQPLPHIAKVQRVVEAPHHVAWQRKQIKTSACIKRTARRGHQGGTGHDGHQEPQRREVWSMLRQPSTLTPHVGDLEHLLQALQVAGDEVQEGEACGEGRGQGSGTRGANKQAGRETSRHTPRRLL